MVIKPRKPVIKVKGMRDGPKDRPRGDRLLNIARSSKLKHSIDIKTANAVLPRRVANHHKLAVATLVPNGTEMEKRNVLSA